MVRNFAKVVDALSSQGDVTAGKMFGAEGLKVGKSVFAMEVKGKLVVKLSQQRAKELQESGLGDAFDPGHGRPMKQWVAVGPQARIDWLSLSREAMHYVASQ